MFHGEQGAFPASFDFRAENFLGRWLGVKNKYLDVCQEYGQNAIPVAHGEGATV